MTYRWLDDLDLALAAKGIPYTPVGFSTLDPTGASDWSTRGRPASTGQFNPSGVLCHHTASPAGTSDQADLNGILCGNSQAPGPVSQLYLGRSGVVYLVAAGRCNHGGQGIRPGVDSHCADMNCHTLGIEAGNSGVGEVWPAVQTTVYAQLVAALCDWYQWDTDRVWLHATTGPPYGGCNSKIDPAGPWELQPDLVGSTTWDLDLWRATVDVYRGAGPPPDESDDDVLPCPALIQASGSDGTMALAVYVTDGRFQTIRWVPDQYQLADIQYWLRNAGQDDQLTSVERVASYGALVGPAPS